MNEVQIQKTGAAEVIQSSDGRLTLSVPIQIKRRGGRQQITLPDGEAGTQRPWGTAATSMQVALARGHRWLAMLESGDVKNLLEIVSKEGIDNSYVSRQINLTTLAPDIVDAILLDAMPEHLSPIDLGISTPLLWEEQRQRVYGHLPQG